MSMTTKTRAPKRKSIAAEKAAQYIAPHLEAILAKTVEFAKAGDPKSQQLALSYGLGTPRPMGTRLDLPEFAAAPTLPEKAAVVAEAMATGRISVDDGDKLMRWIDVATRTVALEELGERVARLESGSKARTIEAAPTTESPAQLALALKSFAAGKALADQPDNELA